MENFALNSLFFIFSCWSPMGVVCHEVGVSQSSSLLFLLLQQEKLIEEKDTMYLYRRIKVQRVIV